MKHEQERQPQPAWQKSLNDFQRARDRAVEEPTSGNMIFAKVFLERLYTELEKPGKFELGLIRATPGAVEELVKSHQVTGEFLIRHKNGDWGELDDKEKALNNQALEEGIRVISTYYTKSEQGLYVITEATREVTTFLKKDEY